MKKVIVFVALFCFTFLIYKNTYAQTILPSPIVITSNLSVGSTGNDVSLLQQFLADQKYFNYPTITGRFGLITKAAVIAFQKMNGLTPDSFVGPMTRTKIAELTRPKTVIVEVPVNHYVNPVRHHARVEEELPTYLLTIIKAGSGNGSVNSTLPGIMCGSNCSIGVTESTAITLVATPNAGSTFVGWSGPCSGTAACNITITEITSVTAVFSLNSYTLTVNKSGTGNGVVTSTPAGINCGATCVAQFSSGTMVNLTASAASGSSFAGWSGPCTGTGSCVVTIDTARTVTATFDSITPPSYTLTVINTATNRGTVGSDPAGISCGATCTASYPTGTVITLTRYTGFDAVFDGWSGACTGIGSTCVVTMTSNIAVSAGFHDIGGAP